MCGIVGLHLRNDTYVDQLGALLTPMLDLMATRGPDSAGLAIYTDRPTPAGRYRYSVRVDGVEEPDEAATAVKQAAAAAAGVLDSSVDVELLRVDGAVLVADDDVEGVTAALVEADPRIIVQGFGRSMEIVKSVGAPIEIAQRYAIEERRGFQGVGHTRMATESAVTIDHSHPFAPNPDLSVVHNGSFSNHATVRRRLEKDGIFCDTDNDTEVCARLIGQQLATGAGLDVAVKEVERQLDGFYTLLVASDNGFAVIRDSFACKPLVVAEHDDYVAVTSEYHAMANLPGIEKARVFEPMPGDIHAWVRS